MTSARMNVHLTLVLLTFGCTCQIANCAPATQRLSFSRDEYNDMRRAWIIEASSFGRPPTETDLEQFILNWHGKLETDRAATKAANRAFRRMPGLTRSRLPL